MSHRIHALRAEVFEAITRSAMDTRMQPAALQCRTEMQGGDTIITIKTADRKIESYRVAVTPIRAKANHLRKAKGRRKCGLETEGTE